MKKIYTIFSVLFMLFVVSCVPEDPAAISALEGPTVPVILSFQEPVVLHARTKADPGMIMDEEPVISSIHVAVFGRDRYLKDYVSAFPCDASGNPISGGGYANQNATTAYFLARLPISSSERVLHIIANGPSALPFNAYENDIMQNLRTSDGNGAYWQRIVLPGGITVKETDGVPTQLPNGEYIPSDATQDALDNLRLIRNFASITVTEEAPNFEIVSYTLCNMPNSGSIAMYSTNHGDWVPYYTDDTVGLNVNHLYEYQADPEDIATKKTYLGFPTNPDLNTDIPTTVAMFNAPGVAVGPGQPVYVYERAVTNDNPPFILMAARYVASGTPTNETPIQYYRLDLALENGYIPIYRNFEYSIVLNSVSVAGYEDPGTASQHNSGSNFSVSLDTRTLPDVSNGLVRLYVEQPNFDWVYNTDTQSFWYKFLLNSAASGNLNSSVTVTEKEGGDAINNLSVASSDGTDNQRSVSYRLNQPDGTSTLSSTIQIVGTYTSGSDTYRLVRTVTIRVFNAKSVTPTLTPSTVADQEGQLTTLGIPLPWDLQASMFPMEILIEDSKKALNPMEYENMPVKTTGIADPNQVFKSLADNTTPSYCFVRTLNWSEYQRLKNDAELSGNESIILNCDFETTKDFGTSKVYVYNKYFATDASGITTAQVTLTGDPDNNITPNRQTVSGTSATVRVKSTGNWTLDIKLADGNVAAGASISPASGSSTTGQDVTVTLPENVTKNAIRYLLTLTNTSASPAITRTAYITQSGILMNLTSATTSVGNGGDTGDIGVTVSVESGVPYVLEVIQGGVVLSTSQEYPATSGTPASRTVTIPVNNTLQTRVFTIRARNLISTIWSDITITQDAGVANLSVTDSEIRMSETSATVHLETSFPAVLKWYNTSNNELVNTMNIEKGERDVEVSVGANNSGSDRTFRVDLCDTGGNVLRTGSFTQLGTPYLALTPAESNIGNTTPSATLNVESEAAWTVSFSGGLSGASLSPASGSATAGTPVTLTVPVNNTLSAQTYTVTAENGAFTKTATVTQAAGTASLSVVDSNIWMTASSATVNVASSFPTVLKVYVPGNDTPVAEKNVSAAAAHNETITGLPANSPGSDRTLRVDLCNSDGAVVATGNITQAGTPVFELTPAATSVIGNQTSTTIHLVSELACDLSVASTGSGTYSISTPSGLSGVSTGAGGTTITLTMPVNYSITDDVTYTVSAVRSGYADESVAITHRKATPVPNQSVTFYCENDTNAHTRYSTTNLSVTQKGITAAFNVIYQINGSRIRSQNQNGFTINFSTDDSIVEITSASFTHPTINYQPTAAYSSCTDGTASWGRPTNWTGPSSSFSISFARNNNYIVLSQFTVTYIGKTWE